MGFINNLSKRISGGIGLAVGVIGTTLGVSSTVSAAILTVGAVSVPVATYSVVSSVGGFGVGTDIAETTLWVDDEEPCEDFIQEAKDETGVGENQIPAPNGDGGFTVTVVDAHGNVPVICWNGDRGNTTPWGDPCKPIFDKWISSGKKDDEGICVIGEYFLVACTDTYGKVGDQVDFFLDDGTKIPCIMADSKNPNDEGCTEWGHENGHNVLEFEITVDAWEKGNRTPGIDNHTDWNGKRVASWTNNGAAVDGSSGILDGADSALGSTKQAAGKNALEECKAKSNFDNSTIAAAAASYAYSQSTSFGDGHPGTMLYDEVWKATINDEYYRSCDRGVAAAVKWSGADDKFEYGGCKAEYNYMSSSPLWEKVTDTDAGFVSDPVGWANEHCEPGDIFCTFENVHTFMYVGNEIAQQAYEQVIKPNGDGDLGQPSDDAVFVNASIGANGAASTRTDGPVSGKAPCIQAEASTNHVYGVFRYKGDYPDKDKYADVGNIAAVSSASSKGTDCECIECRDPNSDIAMDLAWLALSCVSGPEDQTDIVWGINGNPWLRPSAYDKAKDNQGLLNEEKIYDLTLCANGGNTAYASCAQYVAAMTAAVVDMDISGYSDIPIEPYGMNQVSAGPGTMQGYFEAHSEFWKKSYSDGNFTMEDLKPGDVLVTSSSSNHSVGHVAIFVGNELAQKKFPGTNGNVCEAGFAMDGTCRYPRLSNWGNDHVPEYDVFSPIKKNTSSKYGEADYKSSIGWSGGAGNISTSCEEDEEVDNMAIYKKALETLGCPYGRAGFDPTNSDWHSMQMDCSGLAIWSIYQVTGVDLRQYGINCTTEFLDNAVSSGLFREVSRSDIQPGDIICGYSGVGVSGYHTAIAGPDGKTVEQLTGGCQESTQDKLFGYLQDPHVFRFIGKK